MDDIQIPLTAQEFELLWILSAHAGKSLTHERLIENLDDHDLEMSAQEVLPSLLSLKAKIPPPRRLALLGGRAMLI